MLWFEMNRRRVTGDESFSGIEAALRNGKPFGIDDVCELRQALQKAERLVEQYIAAIASGVELGART